jgi:hypothetical protein
MSQLSFLFAAFDMKVALETGADARFWSEWQLSDCNSLSGSNPLTNRILKKLIINIYSYLIKNLLK